MEYLLTFAHEYEDLILYHVLKDIDQVKWIDIEAYDPVIANVTKLFSMRGGYGINVEPQSFLYKKLVKDRPKSMYR